MIDQLKKGLHKQLDGRWTWSVMVWTRKRTMFADCIIKSPEGETFADEGEATVNMNNVLGRLGIKTP